MAPTNGARLQGWSNRLEPLQRARCSGRFGRRSALFGSAGRHSKVAVVGAAGHHPITFFLLLVSLRLWACSMGSIARGILLSQGVKDRLGPLRMHVYMGARRFLGGFAVYVKFNRDGVKAHISERCHTTRHPQLLRMTQSSRCNSHHTRFASGHYVTE